MKKILLIAVAIILGLLLGIGAVAFLFSRKAEAPDKKMSGGVLMISHATYFKAKVEEFLGQQAKYYNPRKIVLMSVDHYNTGLSDISIKGEDFILSDGALSVDQDLIRRMEGLEDAKISRAVFTNEHGINSLVDPVYQNFSEASVLAFTLKDTAPLATVQEVATFIDTNCGDCLVIGSIDCSHYNPSSLAKIHDSYTLSALRELNLEKILKAEIDSPQVAYISAKVAKDRGMKGFDLFFNENTDQDEGSGSETTSVIIGSYSQDETKADPATTFVIAGDVMLDRLINHRFKDDFLDVLADFKDRVFWGADLRMLNLEGPISDNPIDDDISTDNLVFNFPPESSDILKYLKINVASLANNHSENAGRSGLETTRSILSELEIQALGEQSQVDTASVARIEAPIPLSVIGINTLSNDATEINRYISEEKKSDRFIIVFPHWGNEYSQTHNLVQEKMARMWIERGADLIIGSHPHVVQDAQIIDGVPVVYSLGNFIFDQTFSGETQQGVVAAGEISRSGIKLVFLPTEQSTLRPRLVTGSEKDSRVDIILRGLEGVQRLSPDSIFIKNKEGDV